ncbi:Tetraacyldisaccharide 4'-kinase [Rubripirellula tenax]|uniref:Tetraacyldisaccharide 4'-kinase n=2 Tax=Rubripirellula tenax TaxID=2528015 RepID=A0A5C6E9B8_9BACT|nr:Tetraacyldisaccharide 4'-kinase [Rubripirellula tenax]
MLARGVLRVGSFPYAIAVKRRNRQYDSGKLETHAAGVPVISVGNLTTGGTGKTPIVCYLAKWFRSRGRRVMIISRGYGRGDNDVNDEALELHDRLPDVPHVQNPDRVEAARIVVEELEAEVILMDDGFQHRRLHRDLDIVVIDATCPFGYGHLLPRGLLREPITGLTRADLVILTRCDAADAAKLAEIENLIKSVKPNLAVLRSRHVPSGLREFPDLTSPIRSLEGQSVALVAAIGNPDAFEQTVLSCQATVIASKHFPDHDTYSSEVVAEIRQWVRDLGDSIDRVVCTHKDLVKLRTDRIGGKPLVAITIDLEIDGDVSPWLDPIVSSIKDGDSDF